MQDFNGTWVIDIDQSKVWDEAAQAYRPEPVGQEIITLRIEHGVQDYEVLYGDDPVIRMGYTSRYDDAQWVPYGVREITATADTSGTESVEEFRQRIGAVGGPNYRRFEVGKTYALVRTVYVDDRTHYRIGKSEETGLAQNVMLRRLAADGQSYVATVLDSEGVIHRVRRFIRAD